MAPVGPRGRSPWDPDVAALAAANGDDPFVGVRVKVSALLGRLTQFQAEFLAPLERIRALASIAGFTVKSTEGLAAKDRAAMVIPAKGDQPGVIVYDSTMPESRTIYSIAHEIAHSFFGNSAAGVQFRSVHTETSRPGRQLELLCEYGASLIVMPEKDFSKAVAKVGFGLAQVNEIRRGFGTSFEATTYRLAETASIPVAAVKLRYRNAKKDFALVSKPGQLLATREAGEIPPKYRVHLARRSSSFDCVIPYNKSVPPDSCIYLASTADQVTMATEGITFSRGVTRLYQVEAVRAPYQPSGTDVDHPDVLALLRLVI